MSWLTNWLFEPVEETQERTETTLTPEATPPVSDVLLQALLNGEVITREKALTLPAVSGAVDFIANSVASMPVKLYKYKDGKVEELTKDSRVKLLNGDTGDTLDAFQMKKAMVEDYLLGKGGYCYIRRNRNDVTGLFYVEDRYIEIWKTYEPIYKTYKLLVMGREYKPYEFIKLLRNTKDGASGVGLTVEVSKALETAYQTLLYQLGMVSSGGNKKGFLKAQRKLGQDEINVLKQAWSNMYANNTENVVVLNNGLEFQEASNSAVETQLNESKKTLQNEINDIFHISDDYYDTFKYAIYPIVKAFETALNRELLLENEKKNHFFEFDVKEIIRANLKERYESYKMAKETGFMTLNEIRKAENMEYVEGLDVVNVGLGAVLYDINKHVYYTPNTDTVGSPNDDVNSNDNNDNNDANVDENVDKMLEGHELAEAYDESGNSAEREERFNPNHDALGKFTFHHDLLSGGFSGGSSNSNDSKDGASGGDSSKDGRKYGETDTSEALAEIEKGQSNSLMTNMDKNGNLTAEREQLHKDIIDKQLDGKVPVDGQATMTMLGGGPASGKSTVLNTKNPSEHEVVVNPDDMKAELPYYNEMTKKTDKAAGYYHEESSALAKRFSEVAYSENYDVIYDGTGDGKVESVEKKINQARAQGYKVEAKYVTIDTDEAVRRNQERYDKEKAKGGNPRLPSEAYVRECHAKVTDISVATAPKFDHIEVWDNNGAKGQQVKIAEGGNGKYLTAIKGQEQKFQNYLAKGTQGLAGFKTLADGQVVPIDYKGD